MKIHKIADLSNASITNMLTDEFSKITDENIVVNYHPDYSNNPANIFYILANGRYQRGMYYVAETDGKYMCSAGWYPYDEIPGVALVLTRMFVSPEVRTKYLIGTHILPNMLQEACAFSKIWITCNGHNKSIYNWFVRANQHKRSALYNDWPDIYRQFKPIGAQEIYHTLQYVAEFTRPTISDSTIIGSGGNLAC